MSKSDKKKKKKKTVYVDDGRTIADMSGISGRRYSENDPLGTAPRPKSSFKDQMRTYFSTVKAMFLPMLAFMGLITVAFGLVYLILELMS